VARLDERAFASFYERTGRAVWLYVYRSTGHADDADDIVQEAFCRLVLTEIDAADEESLRRYVFKVASNLMTDRWRRANRESSWLERLRGGPEPQVDPEYDDTVSRELALLAPRERALLWLAYAHGASHREIADVLGVKTASIKLLLFRAHKKLAGLLRSRGAS
jgi:RNA polymerase sigma-70 factor (ECF subfamily)